MFDTRDAVRRLVLNAARLTGAAPVAARFLSGVGAILMLHRVNDRPPSAVDLNAHLTITPAFLDAVIARMKRMGYAFVSLDEAVARLVGGAGRGGGRFAVITLDDAYLDNLTHALPVFERHEVPATIYVAPGLTSGEVLPWWEIVEEAVEGADRLYLPTSTGTRAFDCDTPAARRTSARALLDLFTGEIDETLQQEALRHLPKPRTGGDERRFMNWDELRTLSRHRLVTLGAHTIHHYNLARLPAEQAFHEMVDSARVIEIETGRRPLHFAYPYGFETAVGPREVELAAQAGFVSAVTTRHGTLQAGHRDHLFALPRLSLNGRFQKMGHVSTMLSGLTMALANSGRRLVTV